MPFSCPFKLCPLSATIIFYSIISSRLLNPHSIFASNYTINGALHFYNLFIILSHQSPTHYIFLSPLGHLNLFPIYAMTKCHQWVDAFFFPNQGFGKKMLNKPWFTTSVATNDYVSPFNLIHQYSLFMAFELIFNPCDSPHICQFELIAWAFMDAIPNASLQSNYIRSAIFLSFASLVMLSEEVIKFVW